MRTFQFSDAKSHKFWNIDVVGSGFTVTYGKIGTAGQTQVKTFASSEKAQAEADKLVREKTGKGYVETTPQAITSDVEAFEKAIQSNPDDIASWSAYADYLTEQGDPRGEFMQAQIALEDETKTPKQRKELEAKEKALLKASGESWAGGLDDQEDVKFTLTRGWLTEIRFLDLNVTSARALAGTREPRMLHKLIVESVAYDDEADPGTDVPADADEGTGLGLHALCRCPHLKNVRVFRLGETATDENGKEIDYMNCHMPGEMAIHLVKQMPNIEELYLLAHRVDADKIFALPMPKLRVLQLYHSRSYPLEKLAVNKSLANVTTIRCHPHALEYDDESNGAYIRLPQLRALCRAPHMTKLENLTLRLTDFGDDGAKEIVDSGILKRLRVLDLQGGNITDEGAKLLAASPDLKKLQFLNLSSNALTGEGIKAILATGVTANTQHQHAIAETGGDEMPEYLFEGDIE